jgi:hypothetical protein
MRLMVIGVEVESSLATLTLFCSYEQEVLQSRAGGVVVDPQVSALRRVLEGMTRVVWSSRYDTEAMYLGSCKCLTGSRQSCECLRTLKTPRLPRSTEHLHAKRKGPNRKALCWKTSIWCERYVRDVMVKVDGSNFFHCVNCNSDLSCRHPTRPLIRLFPC